MNKTVKFFLSLFLALVSLAHFSSAHGHGREVSEADTIEPVGSKVNILTFSNFHRFVNSHADDLILMEFYAPWCHHCQMLAPEFRQAALELSTADLPRKVVLAKYDDSAEFNRHLRAGAPDVYNFTSYPSLYIFDDGEHERYGGGREADDIIFHMTCLAKGLDPYQEELKTKPGLYKDNPEYNTVVFDLLDEWAFNHTIATSKNNALRVVEFYSDRCPYCKSLSKEVVQAARDLKAKFGTEVEFHAVNSRVYHFVAEDWGITGYPWVCFFYKGAKIEDMAGLGGADSIVRWVSDKHAKHFDPNNSLPEVKKGPYPTLSPEAGEKAKQKKIRRLEAEEKGEPFLDDDEEEEVKVAAVEVKIDAASASVSTVNPIISSTMPDDKGASWRAKLGQNTWFLLHTMAAKYPETPSEEDKIAMMNTIASIGQLYPCKKCRAHLQEKLSTGVVGAPDVGSREGLSIWMCKLHNSVNADLGKPQHDCKPFALDLIYLKDCGECEHDKKGAAKEKAEASTGIWDRELFAKDPVYYQTVVKSETSAWEARELFKLWDIAVKLNLTTTANVNSFKAKVMSGERDQQFYIDVWSGFVDQAKKQ